MRWLVIMLLLLPAAAAVCGDLICEGSEVGSCRDCAMLNPNYRLDSFPNALAQYDPDYRAANTCYSDSFLYENGRGNITYPSKCTSNTVLPCTSDSDCASNFCDTVLSTCVETCRDGCTQKGANYEVYPVSTAIYLGEPTFVSFNVIKKGGSASPSVSVVAPCNVSYDSSISLLGGEAIAVVRINSCDFWGAGSIKLTVGGEAWNVVHFLSYPARLYSVGEMPEGVVGHSAMSGEMDGVPVEVELWFG